jgi:hypothetical protein
VPDKSKDYSMAYPATDPWHLRLKGENILAQGKRSAALGCVHQQIIRPEMAGQGYLALSGQPITCAGIPGRR